MEKLKSRKERLEALKVAVSWTYQSSPKLALIVLAVSIAGGLIAIVEPYLFKLIIDQVAGRPSIESVGIGILGILVVYGVVGMFRNLFWDIFNLVRKVHAFRIEKHVMHNVMEKVSSLDLVYFEDPGYYNTLSKTTNNTWRIAEMFFQFSFGISELMSVIVIVIAVSSFDLTLVALVVAGTIPSVIVAMKWGEGLYSAFAGGSPIFRHAHYYRTMMTEQPEAIKEIKIFGLREHFLKKFRNLFTSFIKKQDKAAKSQLKGYFAIVIIESLTSVAAAWLIIQSFLAGKITIGDVVFLWTILFQFAAHARWMVRMIGDANTNAIFLTPLVKVLHFEPSIKEPGKPEKFPVKISKGIEFRKVSFSYPRAKKQALRKINLEIKPNESIALVGENGSGKSTLIKLLCRLYDASEGEILIDGVNIREYPTKSLYNNIGVIFQDFMKYEALVEENIKYGRLKTEDSRLKTHRAALKAGAEPFILELENAYKTQVGKKLKESGVELSTGQWQKIALARAFFRDAQILILDEPTAAVDAKAEYELFQRFRRLTRNKITILISHRFSTVRMADKIIVMDRGRIAEAGSHKELLKKNGKYARLFRLQAKGYK